MMESTATPKTRIEELSAAERRVLARLEPGKSVDVDALAADLGMEPVQARSAASWLASKGYAELEESTTSLVRLSAEGQRYAKEGLPEQRLWAHLKDLGRVPMDAARQESGLTPEEFSIAMAWWGRKGLGSIQKDGQDRILVAAPKPAASADEAVLKTLAQAGEARPDALEAEGLQLLQGRKGLLVLREEKAVKVRLKFGIQFDRARLESASSAIDEITPEILKSGAWRNQAIRPYDVDTPAPRASAAKPHPFVQIIAQVREIFLEMGFQEIEYDYVQSTFWNMDALFIPQDHPAREMQDTFYLKTPAELPVPEDLVPIVASVHENGGKTGSRGWGGTYDAKEARRALLRTHTTVGTIRHLAENPKKPARVFSVGRVFRKETMDATHLPEFHQVEGIATEPGADFRMLLGILKEFYRRLGFPKLRWRPAYFPYTEPSMEVEVQVDGRWMELGGSGIFRPEVTRPLGVKTPVLAWGLGLERLAMLQLGLKDIRDLYVSDLDWLRRQPLS
jgi:phenylalanyl-tRNA synthetase alpha chain